MKDRKLQGAELGRITPDEYRALPPSGIALVLDNIRSAHNVGSAFRSADAFRAEKVWLCGICATPPSAEIHKTALGAEQSVPWAYEPDTAALVSRLREDGWCIVSVEQTQHALPLDSFHPEAGVRYALVFGNEVDGVRQDVVDASDFALEIPQWGSKHSLNVSVAVGVVLWQFRSGAAR
ncbi:MAG: RNA methyltransferase [Bacteroidales bacterium]|nr:RNA methyltransferase [Bacteroidales bacterium]